MGHSYSTILEQQVPPASADISRQLYIFCCNVATLGKRANLARLSVPFQEANTLAKGENFAPFSTPSNLSKGERVLCPSP